MAGFACAGGARSVDVSPDSMESLSSRPYLGLMLSPQPISAILSEQLRLEKGPGAMISNLLINGPADRAGLKRFDIITSCNGQKVVDGDSLARLALQCEPGKSLAIAIIRQGEPNEVRLTPVPLAEISTTAEWRYAMTDPNNPDDRPADTLVDSIHSLYEQRYEFIGSDGIAFTVTIEGEPTSSSAIITIQRLGEEWTATSGQLDQVPQEYQLATIAALEDARNSERQVIVGQDVPRSIKYNTVNGKGVGIIFGLSRGDQEYYDQNQSEIMRLRQEINSLLMRLQNLNAEIMRLTAGKSPLPTRPHF